MRRVGGRAIGNRSPRGGERLGQGHLSMGPGLPTRAPGYPIPPTPLYRSALTVGAYEPISRRVAGTCCPRSVAPSPPLKHCLLYENHSQQVIEKNLLTLNRRAYGLPQQA